MVSGRLLVYGLHGSCPGCWPGPCCGRPACSQAVDRRGRCPDHSRRFVLLGPAEPHGLHSLLLPRGGLGVLHRIPRGQGGLTDDVCTWRDVIVTDSTLVFLTKHPHDTPPRFFALTCLCGSSNLSHEMQSKQVRSHSINNNSHPTVKVFAIRACCVLAIALGLTFCETRRRLIDMRLSIRSTAVRCRPTTIRNPIRKPLMWWRNGWERNSSRPRNWLA